MWTFMITKYEKGFSTINVNKQDIFNDTSINL